MPSACYSSEQAASLPGGVFSCQGPSDSDSDSDAAAAAAGTTARTYEFVPGLTHTLEDGPVDPEFCDP